MAKKFPGFYLYYDWLDALETLPAKKAMTIIKNLRDYARDGIEPPHLDGHAGSLQTVFAAQIKRSRTNSENGKLGGAPTHKKLDEEKEKTDFASDPPNDSLPEDDPFSCNRMTDEELNQVNFLDFLRLKDRFARELAQAKADLYQFYIDNGEEPPIPPTR